MKEMKVGQPQEPEVHINENIVKANIENLKLEQNLGMGILGGGIGGMLGAAIWAAITYFTDYQIGYMAIGVGFLVGFGMSKLGKGIDKIYGIVGAILALLSVILGNFLVYIGWLAKYFEVGYLEMLLGFNYAMTLELFVELFNIVDILFYGIAIYFGYRYSFRKISRDKLLEGAITTTSK